MQKNTKTIYICWNLDRNRLENHSPNIKETDLVINIHKSSDPPIAKKFKLINIRYINPEQVTKEISAHLDIEIYDKWEPLNIDKIDPQDALQARVIFRKIAEITNAKIMQRNTLLTRSVLFIKNFFSNAKLIDNQINLKDFHNGFVNRPFLIIAAGPSLDKQLEKIKEYQKFFYIISVDKAYPSLKKNDIVADAVITIDPLSTPSWEQDGLHDNTVFITDIGSNPPIVQSNNKNRLFICSNQELNSISSFFNTPSDLLETGGSVATSAFSFAYMCGANPIVMIGQDLAFTNNKDHASDYINAYSKDLIQSKIQGGFTTNGYYGDQVNTDKQLLMYKYWFESKFKKIKDRIIFNCTEGGANIDGAVNVPFATLCHEISKDTPPKKPLLTKIIKNHENPDQISSLMTASKNTIRTLNDVLKQCNEAIRIIDGNNQFLNNQRIERAIEAIRNLDTPLKALISNFNQIEIYSANISISREEKKSKSNFNLHTGTIIKSTAKAIESTIKFLEDN